MKKHSPETQNQIRDVPSDPFLSPQVLVMDDEFLVSTIIQMVLVQAGYRVEKAGSLEQAMEHLNKDPRQIVLADEFLPGISAMDLMGHLTRSHPETVLILMSGDPSSVSEDEALRLGVFDYLHKPFNMDTLLNSIAGASRASREKGPNQVG